MQQLPKIATKYVNLAVTATLADGTRATLLGVDVGLAPLGGGSDSVTTWVPTSFDGRLATFLLAGSAVVGPPAGALVVPVVGADLWARVTDTPEEDAVLVDRITLV